MHVFARVLGSSNHTDDFFGLFQNLRAQEAAQAEAEDKEDLEIAVETGGRNTPAASAINVCCSELICAALLQ